MDLNKMLLSTVLVVFGVFSENNAQDDVLRNLNDVISSLQVQTDHDFKFFPFSWQSVKGMYKNNVKLNFHGEEQYAIIREMFAVPDNNMFTPAWVPVCLLEAWAYGRAPLPRQQQMTSALAAIDKFRNRNRAFPNSEMTFWIQTLNSSTNYFQSYPTNLFGVLTLPDYLPDKLIERILDMIGLKDMEKVFEKLIHEKGMYANAFHIPPDFDDTFVNLGLGALLHQFRHQFPVESRLWDSHNNNLTSVFRAVSKYAYRPFSQDQRVNTIDPRTYFYLRDFLKEAGKRDGDVALISTWMQDTDEVRTQLVKGVAMPFNVNNVDVTVASNFIYGVITSVGTNLSGVTEELINSDVQHIFLDTTSLIVHEIRHNLTSRPDLALTYYPSKFEFFWFVSRSFAWLNRFFIPHYRGSETPLQKMLKSAYDQLRPVVRAEMTTAILRAVKRNTSGEAYIDNFLGNNDFDFFQKPVVRAEDRIFSTSVSIAALINSWTNWENSTLHWDTDTPDIVRVTTKEMVGWLTRHCLSPSYKPWNTFFSGSGKGLKSMPFFYPANRREYFNGTKFSDDKFPTDFKNIVGMQGVVSSSEYGAMLKKPHFGLMTPMTFDGYNSEEGGYFPFWSSDAYTYSTTLVALSHYANIAE